MLVFEEIEVYISYRNVSHYRKLGYSPIINDNLNIKTVDLPSSSHVKVDVKCELCYDVKKIIYCKYIENRKRHGFYSCKKCSRNKAVLTCIEKYGVDNYSKTDECKNRVEKTNLEKYGYKTNLLSPLYQEKIKIILDKKYGDKHFYNINRFGVSNKKKFELDDSVFYLIRDLDLSEDRYSDISFNDDYILYRNECRRLTSKNVKNLLENWNGFDYYDGEYIYDNFKLEHNSPRYPTIDHKVSVYYGYVNKIDFLEISDIKNLCVTKRSINSSKRDRNEDDFMKR